VQVEVAAVLVDLADVRLHGEEVSRGHGEEHGIEARRRRSSLEPSRARTPRAVPTFLVLDARALAPSAHPASSCPGG
jgi:hypothetical protein